MWIKKRNHDNVSSFYSRKLAMLLLQFAEHFISYYRNIFRIDGRGYLQFEIAILKH